MNQRSSSPPNSHCFLFRCRGLSREGSDRRVQIFCCVKSERTSHHHPGGLRHQSEGSRARQILVDNDSRRTQFIHSLSTGSILCRELPSKRTESKPRIFASDSSSRSYKNPAIVESHTLLLRIRANRKFAHDDLFVSLPWRIGHSDHMTEDAHQQM